MNMQSGNTRHHAKQIHKLQPWNYLVSGLCRHFRECTAPYLVTEESLVRLEAFVNNGCYQQRFNPSRSAESGTGMDQWPQHWCDKRSEKGESSSGHGCVYFNFRPCNDLMINDDDQFLSWFHLLYSAMASLLCGCRFWRRWASVPGIKGGEKKNTKRCWCQVFSLNVRNHQFIVEWLGFMRCTEIWWSNMQMIDGTWVLKMCLWGAASPAGTESSIGKQHACISFNGISRTFDPRCNPDW